jgi:hypothetical protein
MESAGYSDTLLPSTKLDGDIPKTVILVNY